MSQRAKRENENASARTNSPNGSFESKAFVSSMMLFLEDSVVKVVAVGSKVGNNLFIHGEKYEL